MAVTTTLAQPGEFAEITAFCGKWLSADPRYFELRMALDPTMRRDRILAARDGDTLVSTARLFDIGIMMGDRTIKCAGIGDVCTDKGWRGKGLATKLLIEAHRVAQEDGYPLTALGTEHHDFYRRVGYECWKRMETIFTLRTGPASPPAGVRRIDFVRDLGLLRRIYGSWTPRLAAYPFRRPEFWEHHHKWTSYHPGEDPTLALIAGENAYVRTSSWGDAVKVIEFGCSANPGLEALADALAGEALKRKDGRIRVPVVCRELAGLLQARSVSAESSGDLSLMLRIADPNALEQAAGGLWKKGEMVPPPGSHFWETDGW